MKKYLFPLLTVLFFACAWLLRYYFFQNKEANIKFKTYEIEFGKISTQKQAKKYIIFQNTGSIPLKIDTITTSCGCTVANWNKKPLKPTEKDSFLVSYNIQNKGEFIRELMIYSNSKSSPDHLFIRGNVVESQK